MFDNVQLSILIKTLRNLGVPAKICKFIQNLVMERELYFVNNDRLNNPFTAHKDMPQDSSLSPILFNLYLHDIWNCLDHGIIILMYADDLILSSNANLNVAVASIQESFISLSTYLYNKGLNISPSKSQCIVFSKTRSAPAFQHLRVNNPDISCCWDLQIFRYLLWQKTDK